MPKWRWLQTELQRIVNTLQIRSPSPGHSGLWLLSRQENSSSKSSTATPSGQSSYLGNPPGQGLLLLWGLQMWTCSSQPKHLSGVNKGRVRFSRVQLDGFGQQGSSPCLGTSLTAVSLPAQAKSKGVQHSAQESALSSAMLNSTH